MHTMATQARVTGLVDTLLAAKGGVPATLHADTPLVDAGLTSMDMVNLMLAVEAEFDIMIPAGDITPANFRTVATVATLVERVSPAAAA